MTRLLQLLAIALMVVVVAPTRAAEATAESAISLTFKDAALKWGGCPPFLPEGCRIAVLHGDPAKPDVDVFFKVPPGAVIPSHWHTSPERMILVSGRLTVTYDGQAPSVMKPGTYAYGPARKPHQAVCAKGQPCVLFIAFREPLDATPLSLSGK